MKKISLMAALLAVSATAALAQTGTVNAYSAADEVKAKAAITAAGFTPGVVGSAQGGALFVTASKGADHFVVTVMPDGHVYGGPTLGTAAGLAADNPNGPKRPGGAPAGGRGPFSGGD